MVENGDKLLHGIGKWGRGKRDGRSPEQRRRRRRSRIILWGLSMRTTLNMITTGSGEEEEDGYGFWPRVVSADDDKEDEWMEDGEGGTRWMWRRRRRRL